MQKPNINPYEYYSASIACSKLGMSGIKELQALVSKHTEGIVWTTRKASNGVETTYYLGASLIILWTLEKEESTIANAEKQEKALDRMRKYNPEAYAKVRKINNSCPTFSTLSAQELRMLQVKELHRLHEEKQVKLRLTDEEIQRKNEARG